MKQRGTHRGVWGLAALLVLCVVNAGASSANDVGPRERREAEFMARSLSLIPRFVEWPDDAFPARNAPFVIGVITPHEPFYRLVAGISRGKMIGSHPIQVRLRPLPHHLRECHVLFVSGESWSNPRFRHMLMRTVKDTAVLTIGEGEGFVHEGGVAGFRHEDGRLILEINDDAARRARLNVSSKLKRLPFCTVVKDAE
jgi:hypothetical protein